MSANTSIEVALLGSGIFAREEHLPAIAASAHLTLRAVYSRSLKSAKAAIAPEQTNDGDEIQFYSDDSESGSQLDDLLLRDDIKAVVIALPIKNQAAYVRRALTAGKHVLSEKPVAENLREAAELIDWYEKEIKPRGTTWGVAENVRFWAATVYAGEQRAKMGKALTFRARVQTLVPRGGKYFETSWRKVPTHQGGFLLDGGVHYAAALRLLLGKDDPLVSISAFTAQLQEYLPPVDTIEAVARSKSGAVGSISISFGTTGRGSEYHVASQDGFVSVSRNVVKVGEKEETIEEEGSGVKPEVRAWGEGLASGKPNELQNPREALADLEIVEACLKSGGKAVELAFQTLEGDDLASKVTV